MYNSVRVHPSPIWCPSTAYEGTQTLICIQYGCEMHSAVVYSLNHDISMSGNGYIVLHAVCPACRSDTFCSVLPFCIRQNVLPMNASISPFISNWMGWIDMNHFYFLGGDHVFTNEWCIVLVSKINKVIKKNSMIHFMLFYQLIMLPFF